MIKQTSHSAKILTTLGALFFLTLSFSKSIGFDQDYSRLNAYALTILAFLSGTHWGLAVSHSEMGPIILVRSNILALMVFFLLYTGQYSPVALSILFGYGLYADFALKKEGYISEDYFKIRQRATIVVLISLAITILLDANLKIL